MLTIRFRADGGYLSLHMDGHATGSPAGWLDRHGAEADSRLEAGTGAVRCRDTAEARTAFEVVAVGLAMLAEAHPDKVQILGKTTGVFPAWMW